jgi:hypothetical protein
LAESLIVSVEDQVARREAILKAAKGRVAVKFVLLAGVLVALASPAFAVLELIDDLSNPQLVAEEAFLAGIAHRQNDVEARLLFQKSARASAAVRHQGTDSTALHRNEGNASLLAGDLPPAILAYRRGLRIDPDDPALRTGLDYARSQVAYPSPSERLALTPRRESPSLGYLRRWGLMALTVLSLAGWVSLTRWRLTRERAWCLIGGLALGLAVILAVGRMAEFDRRQQEAAMPLGVTTRSTVLRKGDGLSFTPRRDFALPAGVELIVRQESGTWLHVELADGSTGWLPRDSVEQQ